MIEGAIFDMDGLMFDSEPVWTELWGPALKHFGYDSVPEGLPDACRGTNGSYEVEMVRKYLGPDVDAKTIVDYFQKMGTQQMIETGVPKKPGLDDLLAYLDVQRVPMAVASSSFLELIESNLEHGHVRQYFSKVVSGTTVAHPKPAPDVFLLAARELGVKPAHTVVFEDSINGIKAAHAGGFLSIMVPDLQTPTPEIREMASAICKDLDEARDLLKEGKIG